MTRPRTDLDRPDVIASLTELATSLADSDLISVTVPDSPAALTPDLVTVTEVTADGDGDGDHEVSTQPQMADDVRSETVTAGHVATPSRISIDTWLTVGLAVGRYGTVVGVIGLVSYGVYALVTSVTTALSSLNVGLTVVALVAVVVTCLALRRLWRRTFGYLATGETLSASGAALASVAAVSSVTIPQPRLRGGGASRASAAAPVAGTGDQLTDAWIGKMRGADTGQVVGGWRRTRHPLFSKPREDRCAVGWLLELDDPNGWDREDDGNGFQHASYQKMQARYGRGVLKRVIKMNDSGVSLRRIARYVERKTS